MNEYEIFHSFFEYSKETGKLTWKVNKGRAIAGNEVGNITLKGYREVKLNQRCFKVHRVIFMMVTGNWPEREIDHINGNKLDNRWSNLRDCMHMENMHNQLQHSHNTSGITGVSWHKRIRKWHAFIINNGKQNHLGYFDSMDDAIKTRKNAEIIMWNDFKKVDDIVSTA